MKKNFLLNILAVAGEITDELRDPFGLVSLPYKKVYGFVPNQYRKNNFTRALNNSIKNKDIKLFSKEKIDYLKLTNKGRENFINNIPLAKYYKKKWDKKWRILIFDIAEKRKAKRNFLRKKLYTLGFGQIQKSVYVSPWQIEKEVDGFIEEQGLFGEVKLFVSETYSIEKGKLLANEVWDLEKINDKYKKIEERIKKEKIEKNDKINEIKLDFIKIFLQDPFLPEELLPDHFFREEAMKEIK